MKTVEETVERIIKEIVNKEAAKRNWVAVYKDGQLSDIKHMDDLLASNSDGFVRLVLKNNLQNLEFKKIEISGFCHEDVDIHFISSKPQLKRIYKCGDVYVSELTSSGTFEFDPEINAAFNFIDWSYEDLLYHEFFRNATGKFLLIENGVIRGETTLFSGVEI